MHVLLAFNAIEFVSDNAKVGLDIIQKEVEDSLGEYNWIEVFEGAYIISVGHEYDRDSISMNMNRIKHKYIGEGDFRFILSPIMTGGAYRGLMQAQMWDVVNNISSSLQ